MYVDVFINNFIGLGQGSQSWCQNIQCCIMQAINQVLAQQDAVMAQQKEAISEKKLDKGDSGWSQ